MKHINTIKFIVVILFVLFLNYTGVFDALNSRIYNNYFDLRQEKFVSDTIVIIGIDNKSLSHLGKWPWDRELFAKVLKNLIKAEPAVIGLFISFTEADKNSQGDRDLAHVLQSNPIIVLAMKLAPYKSGSLDLLIPVEGIFTNVKTGHAAVKYSEKGTVVSITPEKLKPAFSLQVIKVFIENVKGAKEKYVNNKLDDLFQKLSSHKFQYDDSIYIDFKRTPEQYKHYSFVDVLQGKVAPTVFENKIVLIGLTDKTLTSVFSTPFTGVRVHSSTGVELQAQIIDSFLNYRHLRHVSQLVQYMVAIILAIGFYYLLINKRVLVQGFYLVSIFLFLFAIDFYLFYYQALWFPPALPLVLILTTFVISMFFTTTSVDLKIIKTFNSLLESKDMPVVKIPDDLDSRVDSLTTLMEVISTDRQTIKAIIDGVNNGIAVFAENGKIIWANSRLMNIFQDNLVLNQNIESLFTDLNLELMFQEISKNKLFKKEVSACDQDFICIITPIKTSKIEYVAVFNDVTALKQMDRMKTDMVRMVSHELKNPLAAIQICAENITFIDKRDTVIDNAENIISSTKHLIDTINNFLNLSRLENNMIDFTFKKKDINLLINECLKIHQPMVEKNDLNIVFEAEEVSLVWMDINQIMVVVNNILSNAIKYSEKGGQVKIITYQKEKYVYTEIQDQGIGIPEEDVERVFDKFFRSINNKKNNIEGTGLGLSIIRRIIQIHKGNITVSSKYGHGTTFTFSLPVVETEINQDTEYPG
jgi:signal transduction histidine kinase